MRHTKAPHLTVHPRVRGEQSPPSRKDGHCYGSSPRARGADPCAAPYLRQPRFIPACAGSRVLSPIFTVSETVHPRVRGEQYCANSKNQIINGSSPRARGAGAISAMNGIEPSVHPRVRGEQTTSPTSHTSQAGSSPRARGAETYLASNMHRGRFIPACAGSRATAVSTKRSTAVHPRVRGEQFALRSALERDRGSSPRARGAGPLSVAVLSPLRFIPACAGSSYSGTHGHCGPAVHPRVRGEQD